MHLMKILLACTFFFCGINSYSQDAAAITHIDSIVNTINKLHLQVYEDSVTKKIADPEMEMKTYLLEVFDDGVLKKYQYKMKSLDNENGIYTTFIQSTAFYYDQDQLIKVEQSRLQFEKRSDLNWYYSNDTLLKYPGNDPGRSDSFLSAAKEFLKHAHWRQKK